jgi:hypothetical protein
MDGITHRLYNENKHSLILIIKAFVSGVSLVLSLLVFKNNNNNNNNSSLLFPPLSIPLSSIHLPGRLLTQIYFSYPRQYQQDSVPGRYRLYDTEQIRKEKEKGTRG